MIRWTSIVFTALTFLFPLMALAIDSDGDGLADDVEITLGSSALHKDIFVEIDWLIVNGRSMRPRGDFVNIVKTIFANAPVLNPDGTYGINMHITLNQGIRDTRQAIGYMENNGGYNFNDFEAIKRAYFTPSKWSTHHYALFAREIGDEEGLPSTISGISRNGANFRAGASDFIVALGGWWWNKPNAASYKWTQVGTFVHELGHNLGLKHGGVDHVTNKPNLLSVMSYAYQTDGIPYTANNGQRYYLFDYSRRALPGLNENRLNEFTGLGLFAVDLYGVYGARWFQYNSSQDAFVDFEVFNASSNVDWNRSGGLQNLVKTNLNKDTIYNNGSYYHKYSNLPGFEEWTKLIYNGGLVGKAPSIARSTALPAASHVKCLKSTDVSERSGKAADVQHGTYGDLGK